jgi:hypothetical protein
MTVQETLYTALQSTVGGRLYPLVTPSPVTLPYAVYQVISQVPSNVLADTPGLFNTRIQVDVFARTYAECQTLKASVRTAMVSGFGFKATEINTTDLFEEEARLYRVSLDWSVWHN